MPSFIAAEIVGGALAIGVIKMLYPGITPAQAADIIFPHQDRAETASARAAHDGAAPATQPPGPSPPTG